MTTFFKDFGVMNFNEFADMFYLTHDWEDDLIDSDEVRFKAKSLSFQNPPNVKVEIMVYDKSFTTKVWLDDLLIMEDEYYRQEDTLEKETLFYNINNWRK